MPHQRGVRLVPCSVSQFRPLWVGLLGLAGLAGNAMGQGQPPGPEPYFDEELPFSGGNLVGLPQSSGNYGEALAGDLNGDQTPEVVLLRGTKLIVVHGAAIGNDARLVAYDALAAAYAPAGSASGGQKLFYTTATGLKCATFVQGQYVPQVITTSGPWAGAAELHYDALQGALFGVDSTRKQILRSILTAGVVAPATGLFLLTPTVRDMRVIDWDGAGNRELALQLSTGVQVRRQTGVVMATKTAVFLDDPFDAIAVVHRSGGNDTLAWLTRLSDYSSCLQLLDASYLTPFVRGPYSVGVGDYQTLSAGDLDREGRDDLVFSTGTGATVWVVDDLSTLETWAPQAISTQPISLWDDYVPGGSDPLPGAVLCANFFNDFTPGAAPKPLAGIARVLPAFRGLRLFRANPEDGGESFTYQTNDFHSAGLDGLGKWHLRLGGGWSGIDNATEIQMVVRPFRAGDPEPLLYPAATPIIGGVIDGVVLQEFGITNPGLDTRYFAQVRPIQRDNNGAIVQVWRWSILSVTAECGSLLWLANRPGAFQPETTCCLNLPSGGVDIGCGTPPCEGGIGSYVPSAVPQSRMPGSGNTLPGPPN